MFLLGVPAAVAAEDSGGGCPVVATAQGVQVMVSASNNLLLQAPTGAVVPMALSCVNYGIAESSGFASNPYPGETVLAAPAIVRGASGLPVPDYPAYAASRHPSAEESTVEQQGYALSARSTETASESRARTGMGQDGTEAGGTLATASSAVEPEAGTATATATSDTQPVTVNEVLELGRVRSSASAKAGADGKVARTSALSIGRTAVAGQVVEITRDGVKAAGQTAPLPDADPAEQLESAGVRVRYLAEEKTARGVLSAGIAVTVRHQEAETGDVYTAVYTFGRAFAAAAPVEAREGGGTPPVPPLPPVPGSGPAPAEAPAADVSASGDAVASGPAPDQAPAAPAVAADAALEPAVAGPARLVGNPADMGLEGAYLVLVFGGLAVAVIGTLLRVLGVRTRWTA